MISRPLALIPAISATFLLLAAPHVSAAPIPMTVSEKQPAADAGAAKQTKLTKKLNKQLQSSGKGVWLRALPDDRDPGVPVPASWTRNDIWAATVMYQDNPLCGGEVLPTYVFWQYNTEQGYASGDFERDLCYQSWNPNPPDSFTRATAGLVTIKNVDSFDLKTYYPTDANATDKRGGFAGLDASGNPIYVGFYDAGTKDYKGRGCHPSQLDARPSGSSESLLQNYACKCEAALSGNAWSDWVKWWLNNANPEIQPQPDPGSQLAPLGYNYFAGGNDRSVPFWSASSSGTRGWYGKVPMWALDWSSCWTNNLIDMRKLQNALWAYRYKWMNGFVPHVPDQYWAKGLDAASNANGQRYYWGWNEIPVKPSIDKPKNWSAVVIHLPAGMSSLTELTAAARKDLKNQLQAIQQRFGVALNKPSGMQVVVLTEKYKGKQRQKALGMNVDRWARSFGCENFNFNKSFKLRYQAPKGNSPGACFIKQ